MGHRDPIGTRRCNQRNMLQHKRDLAANLKAAWFNARSVQKATRSTGSHDHNATLSHPTAGEPCAQTRHGCRLVHEA